MFKTISRTLTYTVVWESANGIEVSNKKIVLGYSSRAVSKDLHCINPQVTLTGAVGPLNFSNKYVQAFTRSPVNQCSQN